MNTTASRRPLLVIEDSDLDYDILEMCLRNVGVSNRIDRCATGDEIESYLERVGTDFEVPIFVFLDLNLPGADGHLVLKQLKSSAALSVIPVVVLTTSSRPKDIEQSYKTGAAGFLTKPIDVNKFETMVQQVADYWFSCVRLPEKFELA